MGRIVLLTGASGFIGRHLLNNLLITTDFDFVILNRIKSICQNDSILSHNRVSYITYDRIDEMSSILFNAHILIHLAGKAHYSFSEFEYYRTNVELTEYLGNLAVNLHIPHLIFLSSIGVHGRYSPEGITFTEKSPYSPYNAYSRSKMHAETRLMSISKSSNLRITIIRPPMVYGPGASANFALLKKLSELSIPLPLGYINNRRSFIGIRNLCNFIQTCIDDETSKHEAYIIRDRDLLSTSEFFSLMQNEAGVHSKNFFVYPALAKIASICLKKPHFYEQIFLSLDSSIEKVERLLKWRAPYSTQEELHYALKRKEK